MIAIVFTLLAASQVTADAYENKGSRVATIAATHALHGLPNLSGNWYYAGPFDNPGRKGFDAVYEPEKAVDLKATYIGKNGALVTWKPFPKFVPGQVHDLADLFLGADSEAVVYLYHSCEATIACEIPLSLGSDDTLSVWSNGSRVLHEDRERPAEPDQYRAEWKIKPGKNELLLKVCQYGGEWAFVAAADASPNLPEAVRKRIDRDYPVDTVAKKPNKISSDEARYYRIVTIEPPKDCVLEVGGLAFRPDGKLYICTRRGEIWLLHNPLATADWKFTRFATGLHEPLGLLVEPDGSLLVTQRPELTRLVDRNSDDVADDFITICDRWGVSGGYHEYAFGPAKDAQGNFFITLNVGFSSGGQSPVPWRGWCVKVRPDGSMEPWAYGLRSPNGVTFSPDGELFYADNQGEWVATNKLHHIKRGKFYGHQASLQWVKDSPFANSVNAKVKSGMNYDGQAGPSGASGMPEIDPPVIWYPYGRMGQSVTEPRWDTTGGKFGPFAGQCFTGDQTRAIVMRNTLEQVGGVWQGACYPFRGGLQCGVNRIHFASDDSLFTGQTSRGWGSVGGKPFGLQRIIFTGEIPLEIERMTQAAAGFELRFTRPVDVKSLVAESFALRSYTYTYLSNYGCPEKDVQAEPFTVASVGGDGKSVVLAVPGRKIGRVYDLRAAGVKAVSGEPLLHPEAYYTLNAVAK
jgi:hypothetical protein